MVAMAKKVSYENISILVGLSLFLLAVVLDEEQKSIQILERNIC